MTRDERARRFFANPFLWIGIAYFGLAIAYVIGGLALQRVADESASRAAEQKSQAVAQVSACVDSIDRAPQIGALIDSIRDNAADRLVATQAAIAATDPDDPLNDARRTSIRTIRFRLEKIDAVARRLDESTPTRKACRRLARKVGVSDPFPKLQE